jgi:uncharacterized protein (PEP-CTERM system associated)
MLGAINTATVTLVRKEQRGFGVRITGEGGALDEDFRQKGVHANLARKLSPFTTLTLVATSLTTESLSAVPRHSTQHLYSLFLSTRVGPRTSASFGVRRAAFTSSVQLESYRENAVFASVSVRL